MNRRKAKKRIKKKWRLPSWPEHASPREVDRLLCALLKLCTADLGKALENAILYGTPDGGLVLKGVDMARSEADA